MFFKDNFTLEQNQKENHSGIDQQNSNMSVRPNEKNQNQVCSMKDTVQESRKDH